jgi:hypothetical protein
VSAGRGGSKEVTVAADCQTAYGGFGNWQSYWVVVWGGFREMGGRWVTEQTGRLLKLLNSTVTLLTLLFL